MIKIGIEGTDPTMIGSMGGSGTYGEIDGSSGIAITVGM